MNATITHRLHTTPDALGPARRKIERDFAGLVEAQPRVLHLALNEAEALAWQTGFPELVFPLLAHEKATHVARWHERQQAIRPNREDPALVERRQQSYRAATTNTRFPCHRESAFVPNPLRAATNGTAERTEVTPELFVSARDLERVLPRELALLQTGESNQDRNPKAP